MGVSLLHIGAEHPGLIWILVPSLLSFLAGLGLGRYTGRLRKWLRPEGAEATN